MTEQEFDEVLKKAMKQYVENSVENVEAFVDKEADVEFSDRFKRRMNRLFRERAGFKKAMHPEVDNWYERTRSRIVRGALVAADKTKKAFKRGNPT